MCPPDPPHDPDADPPAATPDAPPDDELVADTAAVDEEIDVLELEEELAPTPSRVVPPPPPRRPPPTPPPIEATRTVIEAAPPVDVAELSPSAAQELEGEPEPVSIAIDLNTAPPEVAPVAVVAPEAEPVSTSAPEVEPEPVSASAPAPEPEPEPVAASAPDPDADLPSADATVATELPADLSDAAEDISEGMELIEDTASSDTAAPAPPSSTAATVIPAAPTIPPGVRPGPPPRPPALTFSGTPTRPGAPLPPMPRASGEPAPPIAIDADVLTRAVDAARVRDPAADAVRLRALVDAEAADERRKDTPASRARVAVLALELGDLLERHLGDDAGALKAYGRALAADPTYRPNLWAMRRAFRKRGMWPNLLKLIDAELRLAVTDAERSELAVERASLLADELDDAPGAAEACADALAKDPSSPAALLLAERLAAQAGDREKSIELWIRLAEVVPSPGRRVAYYLDAARALAEREEGVSLALDVLAQAIAVGVDRDRILLERQRLAERSGDPQALIAALDARAAAAADGLPPEGDPARGPRLRELVALRRRQARIATRERDPEKALAFLELAALHAPEDALVLADLADGAEAAQKWDLLEQACDRLAALESDPARLLALGLRRADALSRGGRGSEADLVLEAVIAAAPGYLPVLALRERHALERTDLSTLAAIGEAEADAAAEGTAFGAGAPAPPDLAWASSSLVVAGDRLARAGESNRAGEAYARAVELDPTSETAHLALAGHHERMGNPEEACRVLEVWAAKLSVDLPDGPSGRDMLAALLERLALLREAQRNVPEAIAVVLRLRALRPDDVSLAFRLADLYEEAGRSDERIRLLEPIADALADAPRRAALYVELARAAEEDQLAPSRAIDLYRKAVATGEDHGFARASLAALLRRTGRWEELIAERRAEADAQADRPAGVAALREVAAILETKLGRAEEAASIYLELADQAPGDTAILRRLAAAPAPLARVAELAERELQALPEGAARGQAGVRLAELHEKLGKLDDADASFARAVAEGGTAAHAVWGRLALAMKRGQAGAVAAALGELGGPLVDVEDETPRKLGQALIEESAWLSLPDREHARPRFEQAAARAPGRTGARLGLALTTDGTPAARAAAVLDLAGHVTDPRVASALFRRSAAFSEAAGDKTRARALARRALDLRPDEAAALLAVADRTLDAPDSPTTDVELGERRARSRRDLLERLADLSPEGVARRELELDLAVELGRRGRLADAGRVLARLLEKQPDHVGALVHLRAIAIAAEDTRTQVSAALALGRSLEHAESAGKMRAEAASLVDRTLEQPERAAPLWRAVLDKLPLDDAAYARAHELFRAADDTTALEELIGHRLRHVGGPREEIPYRLERAALRSKQKNVDAAARDLLRILEHEPTHAEALWALADVRIAEEQPAAGATLLERYLRVPSVENDPTRSVLARKRLAALLFQPLGDLEGAAAELARVVEDAPDDIDARERLIDVLEARADWEAAAAELQQLGARRGDRFARAKDELRAARIFANKLRDRGRARRALDRARQLDPLDVDTIKELAEIGEGRRVVGEAILDLRRAAEADPENPTLYERLSQVAELAGEPALTAAADGALVALGGRGRVLERWATHLRGQMARVPGVRRTLGTEEWHGTILHPGTAVPLSEVWRALAEGSARVRGVEPGALGFTKRDLVPWKVLPQKYPLVAAVAQLFGLGEIEVYVAAERKGAARAVPFELPALCLGLDVAQGASPEARYLLGRSAGEVRLGTGGLDGLGDAELTTLIGAALVTAGGDPARLPHLAEVARGNRLEELARSLAKAMPRRDKKALSAVAGRLAEPFDLAAWRDAVELTARRCGLLVSGATDVAARGAPPILVRDLLPWSVSEPLVLLRTGLGLD